MTTDRELLEGAAKAAGLKTWWGSEWQSDIMFQEVSPHSSGLITGRQWNPLTDDGDALRLAVKLQMRVQANARAAIASGKHGTTSEKILNGDPYAATRRVIVRAAYEISRSMT